MFEIITIGGATRDIIFCTEKGKIIKTSNPLCQKLLGFEYGAKFVIKNAHFSFGGGAQNTAIAFSRLGLKTAAILKIGKDPRGKLILENLKKERVDTRFVQIDPKFPSGLSFIISGERAKDHLAFCFRGANDYLQITDHKLPIARQTKWIYLSSLSGSWQEALDTITKNLQSVKSGSKHLISKLAWNPGSLQIEAGISKLKKNLALTEVLLVNRDEAAELISSAENSKNLKKKLKDIKFLLKFLKDYQPKIVVITQGRKGAWLYDGRKFYFHRASPDQPVETTGAGDAFGSGFVAGLIFYKNNLEKALDLAVRNSGSVVSNYGAQQGLLRKQ